VTRLILPLEDELFRVWRRTPWITYIRNGEPRGFISVEGLLLSRTLTGSDQDDEVARNEARDILDFGLAKFTAASDMMQRTLSLVEGITIEACNCSAAFLYVFVHPIMLTITN
jgi:hypothetical protein